MKGRPSKTADSSAAQRALHTLHAHAPKVFEDQYALRLAGPFWRILVGPAPMARLFQRWFSWLMPMVAHHLARARHVENLLDKMLLNGRVQYVLMGAGMDSFALRRADICDKVTVFELDHPATQAVKRQRLLASGLQEPGNVTYIPVDFEVQTISSALSNSKFNRDTPTLFSWMGVTPYLTEQSIKATLKDISGIGTPGSFLMFDTLDRAAFSVGRSSHVGRKMFDATEKMGEPMLSGFDGVEIPGLLAECGLLLDETVTAEQFRRLWFESRRDGLRPWEHMYVVCASCPGS